MGLSWLQLRYEEHMEGMKSGFTSMRGMSSEREPAKTFDGHEQDKLDIFLLPFSTSSSSLFGAKRGPTFLYLILT